jgi:hypothetical protein
MEMTQWTYISQETVNSILFFHPSVRDLNNRLYLSKSHMSLIDHSTIEITVKTSRLNQSASFCLLLGKVCLADWLIDFIPVCYCLFSSTNLFWSLSKSDWFLHISYSFLQISDWFLSYL